MKWLLAALLFCAPVQAGVLPDGWKAVGATKWGGLNLLNDSVEIDGDCQDCQNVLTDSSFLEKRPGNVLLTTILSSNSVTFVGDWAAPNGTRYLIAQASSTIYQTNFSGVPVALSTMQAGYNINMAPAFSKLYFADGFRPLWYWDDASTGTVTDLISGVGSGQTAPICTYVAFANSRLYCANIPGQVSGGVAPIGSSTVDVSSSGGANFWQVPYNASLIDGAPNSWTFAPNYGDPITCLAPTPWGVFVGKRYSTHMIKGTGNLTAGLRVLDPKIGCVDNRSVQMVYGVLQWLGADGVYGYDGAGPPRLLSRELDPLMNVVREATYSEGQWATQLQPDWALGSTSTTTLNLPAQSWDYKTVLSGQIFPSSATFYDDNRAPPAYAGGVGFSSDTLVNIDTISFGGPAGVGWAQIAPSTSGILVWRSTFSGLSNTCYATAETTWTLYSGAFNYNGGGALPTPPGSIAGNYTGGSIDNEIYTVAPSSVSAPSGGWTYGAWQVYWAGANASGQGNLYGSCWPMSSEVCMDFHFISQNSPGPNWTGYGMNVVSGNCNGSICALVVNLYNQSAPGVQNILGSANITIAETGSPAPFTQFTITRTPGGAMLVYMGTTTIINVAASVFVPDGRPIITELILRSIAPTYGGINFSSGVYFNGFGTNNGVLTSRIYDSGMGAPVYGTFKATYTITTDGATAMTFSVRDSTSPNNDMWTAYQSTSSLPSGIHRRYMQAKAVFSTSVASETPKLSSLELFAITTGYYYSNVQYIGTNITTWKQFSINEPNPGTYKYWVRTATYAFAFDAASPAWVAQTANFNVAASTGIYAQFALDSTGIINADAVIGATSLSPVSLEGITGVFLRWASGANIPVASAALERRYMLCVAISTAATVPDTCLIRQKNNKWVYWKGPSVGALGLYNYNIVAADGGTSSKIWKIMQPGVYQDDGAPIDAYWITADFTDGILYNQKTLYEIWMDALPVQASSVTVSYMTDKSGAWVDSVQSLDNAGAAPASQFWYNKAQYGSLNRWIPLTAGTVYGKYFRLKFEDNNLNSLSRINDFRLYLMDQPRTVP